MLSPDASTLHHQDPLSRTHLEGPEIRPRSAVYSTGPQSMSPEDMKIERLSWGFLALKLSILF